MKEELVREHKMQDKKHSIQSLIEKLKQMQDFGFDTVEIYDENMNEGVEISFLFAPAPQPSTPKE